MGQSTQIQPLASGASLTIAATQAIGPNPSRSSLWLHNPNASLNVLVAPLGVTTSPGGAGWLIIFPGGFIQFNAKPRATCGWQAAMASSTGNITVLEWPAD